MCYESWRYFGFYPGSRMYSWHCQPVGGLIFSIIVFRTQVDYGDNPDSNRILSLAWWYFFSKFVDLLDTIFFIARFFKVLKSLSSLFSTLPPQEEVHPCVCSPRGSPQHPALAVLVGAQVPRSTFLSTFAVGSNHFPQVCGRWPGRLWSLPQLW